MVIGNTVRDGRAAGIRFADQLGGEVRGNRSTGNWGEGLYVHPESRGMAIHDNDLRGNDMLSLGYADCTDDTQGTGTAGTANRWWRDLGRTSSPQGLCSPAG